MKRGLFVKYVILFVGLVSFVLVINAALDLYFVYQDNRRASIDVQREKAESAAQKIESFVHEIERQIGWVAYAQFDSLPAEQRRFDYVRLLRQVPAITELAQLDRNGHEQLKVSRLSMDVVGSELDRSKEPAFVEAKANKVYYGPVYFRKESEPYLTMAVAHGGKGGVTVAEVNLKLAWDVVSQIKVGQDGYAYVVDRIGRLVAHPDISLVLRGTNMSQLSQVAAALGAQGGDTGPVDARNRAGVSVLSAHAAIPALNWLVFVELPTAEAQKPVIDSGLRDLALLVLGLLIAGTAAALLARRMVVPIRTLQEGAERIGGGDLGHRLAIKTGDELEALAEQFNRSAAALQESYADLEQKVEDRTHALTRSIDELTASAEILRLIASAPEDLRPMFETMLDHATRLCGAKYGVLWLLQEDGKVSAAAQRNVPEAFAAFLGKGPLLLGPDTPSGRAIASRSPQQILDVLAYEGDDPVRRATGQLGGARTLVAVPMLRKDEVVGVMALFRQEVRTFEEAQIKLVQTFADQAVIAIENTRLLHELRARTAELETKNVAISESLEQQTATAEILEVISQSPTDVQPVLDAVANAARRFCGADNANIWLKEVDKLVRAAWAGSGERGPADILLDRSSAAGRAFIDRQTLHLPDLREVDPTEFAGSMALSRSTGIRAVLAAPMLREGEAIGSISLPKQAAGPFSARQIELLETFAAQAVIAIENVRLFTELRESLEQQTASAEILQVISQSPTDVAPVLDVVAKAALRFCGAPDAMISLREKSDIVVASHEGPFLTTQLRQPPDRSLIAWRAILDAETVHLPDYSALDPAEFRMSLEMARMNGTRAALAAPMLREGEAIGSILLRRPEPGAFTPRQIELLESFAAQAVIAIENVRLFTELRESLDQQTASAEILRVISESPTNVQPVLDAVTKAALRFCGAQDSLILLRDRDEIVVAAHEGEVAVPDSGLRRRPLDRDSGSGLAILEARTIHIPDVTTLDPKELPTSHRLAAESHYRAVLCTPMMREDAAIGSIVLRRSEAGEFSPRQIELLETFAAQAVIAIENVRLFTEIQEKSHQLEVASQHKSQFLANMSHELRTPLNAILGYTEMMVDGLYGDVPEKAQAVLERVQSNGKHLLGLINDVLDLSKIEAGQLVLAVEDYSVADMVATVVAATESLARAKNLALETSVTAGLPRGAGDARRLTQVLLNLVGNAIKFTDQGKIEISARQSRGRFKLSVADSGPGIAPANQARIFDEFQQVDNTSTRKKGGTGLGLSISRRIVELHGGRIVVESELGKGSTFTVVIPVHVAPVKEAAQ
jgi:signal transduction histidine kinase